MQRKFYRCGAGTVLVGLALVIPQIRGGDAQAQAPGSQPPPVPIMPPGPAKYPGPMNPPGTTAPGTTAPTMPPYGLPTPSAVPGVVVPNGYPGSNSTTPPVRATIGPGDFETEVNSERPRQGFIAPSLMQGERPLPINLATALKLANAEAWDIGIAAQQTRVAAAQLTQADVLWLPTLATGVDYQHHDGPIQNIDGSVSNQVNRNSLELGTAPELTFTFTEAIFEPLAARQTLIARKADLQTATNDTTYSVARAYFDVQQARGVLAGTQDTITRMIKVLQRVERMAPDIVPKVEVARARAVLEGYKQQEASYRENWNVASAELARIVRVDPTAQLIPLEPPHLKVTLVSPEQSLDNLLPVALASRPELVSYRALTEAALKRWREEQFRPLLPAVYLRGGSNGGSQLPDSMMFGAYSGGANGAFGDMKGRADYELQVMWELQNLGLGNLAAMKRRRAEYDVTRMQAYRLQDYVAREVAAAYAIVRSARERAIRAEEELKQAEESATLNYLGLAEIKRLGEILIPTIRPQEADVAMSALLQAYEHYYGTIADYNRAQFQLYHALGNPAQLIPTLEQNPEGGVQSNPNPAPAPSAKSQPPSVPGISGQVPGVIAPATIPAAAAAGPAGTTAVSMPPRETPTAASPADPAMAAQPTAPANTAGQVVQTAGATAASPASMLVRLPETAELYCDGVKMKMTGRERNFVTPPLPAGRPFPYEIRIRWQTPDGKPQEIVRQVQVSAGQQTTVDFFGR